MKRKHTCTTYFAKSKTGSNRENKSYNQIKMCMCVEFFWMKLAPFSAWLYLLFWSMGYLSFSFPFSHASGHGYFFFFFRIAHIPFAICRIMLKRWSILVWMAGMFLLNFQSRSQHENIWSVRDLDLKSMKRISQGSQTIWQYSMQLQVAYVKRFSKIYQHMALVGISCHWGTKLFYFFTK